MHFHHERALSSCQVVRCSNSGENLIHNRNFRIICRNKRANLCHQRNQCHLSHIGRFSCHIRACNQQHPIGFVVQIGIIRHKNVIAEHPFHNGMSAATNLNHAIHGNFRLCVLVFNRNICECCQYIHLCNRRGGFLYLLQLCSKAIPNFYIQRFFQPQGFFLGTENIVFCLFQVWCNESLAVGECLFPDVIIRH